MKGEEKWVWRVSQLMLSIDGDVMALPWVRITFLFGMNGALRQPEKLVEIFMKFGGISYSNLMDSIDGNVNPLMWGSHFFSILWNFMEYL